MEFNCLVLCEDTDVDRDEVVDAVGGTCNHIKWDMKAELTERLQSSSCYLESGTVVLLTKTPCIQRLL